MTAPRRADSTPRVYAVTYVDRDRGSHNALHSMAGPEFTGIGAMYAPLGVLPPKLRLGALAVLILIAMVGCTTAWIDYKQYTPSPNVCRSVNSGVPPERGGSCVPASEVSGVR
ncbi:hypothetical protein [Nocardia iowensis]|uniref:Uncharacterized protein n=1 Tax=Nocardia iowensis TaxID=204891 RepID=A0ABX8RY26_NOCIO|nr:hypothetical protein [Nocardia iowensis]QXN94563.1 hypothetical protein KV110_16825 [Nocardia iowensis]